MPERRGSVKPRHTFERQLMVVRGRRYLITGGAGFIGSNFLRHLAMNDRGATFTNLDALAKGGAIATAAELNALPGHRFIHGDILDMDLVERLMPDHDVVVHFAAESHVDRSIQSPSRFLRTNVVGTGVLLDAARRHRIPRFILVSTDEVYGSIPDGHATEDSPLNPSSPYAASKAGAELVARSFAITFDYPVVTTRCTNNYGAYQFPEKMIPLFVTNLLDGRKVPLYGDGSNERDWLYVEDHCSALHLLVDEGAAGEVYNIGTGSQLSNLEVTRRILDLLDMDETWIRPVADRPGHDFRYAVDSSKLRKLGWRPVKSFDDRLERTVEWYRTRSDWWRPIKASLETPGPAEAKT
jgi:dTDP-glucose 4,6-dehydratase